MSGPFSNSYKAQRIVLEKYVAGHERRKALHAQLHLLAENPYPAENELLALKDTIKLLKNLGSAGTVDGLAPSVALPLFA